MSTNIEGYPIETINQGEIELIKIIRTLTKKDVMELSLRNGNLDWAIVSSSIAIPTPTEEYGTILDYYVKGSSDAK